MIKAACVHQPFGWPTAIDVEGADTEECAKKALDAWIKDGKVKLVRVGCDFDVVHVFPYGEPAKHCFSRVILWHDAPPLTTETAIEIIQDASRLTSGRSKLEVEQVIEWIRLQISREPNS